MNRSFRLATITLASFILTGDAWACSVCIAHAFGSAIHAIGAQTIHNGGTVVGVSFTSFSKDQDGEDPGTTEGHRQSEYDLHILHGLNDQWMLRADIPFVFKRLTMTGEAPTDTRGLGDISLGATYQIKPSNRDKVLFATNFDLKLPTGANRIKDSSGNVLEAHSQVGTGSTDITIGVVATGDLKNGDLLFAGLSSRINGSNREGYRYGNVLFYNLGYSHKLSSNSSMVFEFNGRFANKDRTEDGSKDENSGGHFGYLSISYRQSLSKEYGLIGTYQLPVIRSLNGSQRESGLLTIGLYKRL